MSALAIFEPFFSVFVSVTVSGFSCFFFLAFGFGFRCNIV